MASSALRERFLIQYNKKDEIASGKLWMIFLEYYPELDEENVR